MPIEKLQICSSIGILLAAWISLSLSPQASAQNPEFSCRPNATNDGWVCTSNVPDNRDTDPAPERYDSPAAVFPADPSQPEPATPTPLQPAQASQQPGPTAPAEQVVTATDPTPVIELADLELDIYPRDWVPREAMTLEQQSVLASNCCGGFIDPLAGLGVTGGDPDSAPTVFDAQQGLTQPAPNLIALDGDVIVTQGSRIVQNDEHTTIDQDANTILLEGDVRMREPGIMLRGNSAFIDNDARANRITQAEYVLHNYGAHGEAESIVYNSDSGIVTIENGEFSRCEPDSNFWKLSAESIILDQAEGRGYARAVSLRIADVPVFYYPGTLPFPLGDERISGFLAPSTGSTRNGGFDFELPYYFNLAPHYDATLSPRWISDRGLLTSGEFRYLASWSMNTLNAALLNDDKLFDPATVDVPGSDSPPTDNRWFVGFEHFGALGRNWNTFVDYNAVSDEDYFYDLGSNGLNATSRTHLNRQARLNFNSSFVRAGLNVQRLQIIDPFVPRANLNRPFDRLPQFYFNTETALPGGFEIGLRGEINSFDRNLDEALLTQTQMENGALINGERVNLEPFLAWSMETPGWFVRTRATYKHMSYSLENQALGTADDPEVGVPVYSVDSGLVFERERRNGGSQTLEPRLFYLYSEFEDQSLLPNFDTSQLNFSFYQLFRDDRFAGGDRIADADQLSLALTTRLLDRSGREQARFSIGQIQYFEDRLVQLTTALNNWIPQNSVTASESALASEFAYRIGDNWRLNGDVQWNENTEEVQEGSFQLRYQRDSDHLFNLAYRYRSLLNNNPFAVLPAGIDPRIKQTDASVVWPVSSRWKLLARWNYDHSNSRNLESFAGIEYSNCCSTIRVVGREWVDEDELFLPNIEPNRGIFVQITLHGLGNITGGGLSNLLSEGIWGFKETEYE